MKDAALSIGAIAALEALRWWAGVGVAFVVALVALAFCVGVFWGAGEATRRHGEDLREVAEEAAK